MHVGIDSIPQDPEQDKQFRKQMEGSMYKWTFYILKTLLWVDLLFTLQQGCTVTL